MSKPSFTGVVFVFGILSVMLVATILQLTLGAFAGVLWSGGAFGLGVILSGGCEP